MTSSFLFPSRPRIQILRVFPRTFWALPWTEVVVDAEKCFESIQSGSWVGPAFELCGWITVWFGSSKYTFLIFPGRILGGIIIPFLTNQYDMYNENDRGFWALLNWKRFTPHEKWNSVLGERRFGFVGWAHGRFKAPMVSEFIERSPLIPIMMIDSMPNGPPAQGHFLFRACWSHPFPSSRGTFYVLPITLFVG